MTTITTAIPVYNGEPFLRETLDSLAAQTRLPDRVVVFDNCSTDGTPDILKSYRDLPIEYHRNDTNIGHTRNLNRCLDEAARTDYLHLLLADDLVKPRFLEVLSSALEGEDGRALAFSAVEVIDENGRLLGEESDFSLSYRPATGDRPMPLKLRDFLSDQSELQTALVPAVLLKTGRLPPPTSFPLDLPQVGDCLFYGEWATHGSAVIYIPETLCQYRRHGASGTNEHMRSVAHWVLDEWKVMTLLASRIQENPLARWLRRQRLRCLFAARSRVKIDTFRESHPGYAKEIETAARPAVPWLHWRLGNAAVRLRDWTGKRKP